MTRIAVRAVRHAALGVTLGVALAYAVVMVVCGPRGRPA